MIKCQTFLGVILIGIVGTGLAASERRTDFEAWREYFLNPPKEYRIIQYGKPEPNQIRQWKEYGIGGCMAFFHNELRDAADSRYADSMKIPGMLEAACSEGFKVWLADDYGYPSGMAGGRVVENNPEYEARGLVRLKLEGEGANAVSLTLPENLERIVRAALYPLKNGLPDYKAGEAVSFEKRTASSKGRVGAWRLEVYALKVINEDSQAQTTMTQFGHTGRYPDLLNADAVASFLNLFHERLEEAAGGLHGKVEGFYTNEPNLMRAHFNWQDPDRKTGLYAQMPWNEELPAFFKEMHGYDLMPELGALFEGDGKEDRRVRMHFQKTVSEMLANNFARQISDWCAARGLRSSGHFLLNEYLSMHVAGYGDLMKFASEFDVPALDIGIPNSDGIDEFPYQQTKFFSSVAAWRERPEVICLPDPIIAGGGVRRLSPAIPLVRNTINMAFLHGANQMTSYLHLNPMDRDGQKADGYTPEEYTALNEYVGRISMLLRGAHRAVPVALLYPIRMFQADYKPTQLIFNQAVIPHQARQEAWEQTEHTLLEAGLDYEIIHPEALENAVVEDGFLKIGWGRYRVLVMPQVEILSRAAMEKLQEFEAAGGNVFWVEQKPQMAEYAKNDNWLAEQMAGVGIIAKNELKNRLAPTEALWIETAGHPASVAFFRKKGISLGYVVNRSAIEIILPVRTKKPLAVLDPLSGEVFEAVVREQITIPAWSSLLLIENEQL